MIPIPELRLAFERLDAECHSFVARLDAYDELKPRLSARLNKRCAEMIATLANLTGESLGTHKPSTTDASGD